MPELELTDEQFDRLDKTGKLDIDYGDGKLILLKKKKKLLGII